MKWMEYLSCGQKNELNWRVVVFMRIKEKTVRMASLMLILRLAN
jgi:hypothetical protein